MATTGFWPVKDRLKEVIDYAENPDKTIDKKYVDSDLYAALQYVYNDDKTDQRMYVSGINYNAKRAYERMTATKKRFGKTGGNVAYHGYQWTIVKRMHKILCNFFLRAADYFLTVHMGAAVCQMERRGIQTNIGNLNRDIKAANSLMQSIARWCAI